ncbi:hypothetical protein [Sulfobacillus harzensis]|uniref:Uncharacterized protein n=1 Tax=Sulfobacillus harzensis TaxID=2729629 RepID=A0A7Y0L6U6_9FIRM|nr:hypothetical protein [Sulfobacillus harzensis]NMP24404.1 hypothetical protein [Sulfobacillus harzensis]
MSIRSRVFALIVTATTEDADFSDPQDLSEVATVMDGALARGVETLRDLTLYEITPDDGPDSAVWQAMQQEAHRQLVVLAGDAPRTDDADLLATIAAVVDGARRAYQVVVAHRQSPNDDVVLEAIQAYKTVAAACRQLRRLLDTSNLSPALVERIRSDCALLQHWGEDLVRAMNITL